MLLIIILIRHLGYFCNRLGNSSVAFTGYLICGTSFILLRLSDKDDLSNKVVLVAVLITVGIAMCMIMTPVLTEVFSTVEAMEESNPGRFGQHGAFAQAV